MIYIDLQMMYLLKTSKKRWFSMIFSSNVPSFRLHELGSITSRMARQGLHRGLNHKSWFVGEKKEQIWSVN